MKTIRKPEQILLITAILLLGASIVHYKDIGAFNFRGVNYSIPIKQFCWGWAVILGALWAGYLSAKSNLSSLKLVWVHVLFTMVALIITFSVITAGDFIPKPDNVQLSAAGIFFVTGQICLIWNIVKGVRK